MRTLAAAAVPGPWEKTGPLEATCFPSASLARLLHQVPVTCLLQPIFSLQSCPGTSPRLSGAGTEGECPGDISAQSPGSEPCPETRLCGYFLRACVRWAPSWMLGSRREQDTWFLLPQSPLFRERRLKTKPTHKRIIRTSISENAKCHEATNTR